MKLNSMCGGDDVVKATREVERKLLKVRSIKGQCWLVWGLVCQREEEEEEEGEDTKGREGFL